MILALPLDIDMAWDGNRHGSWVLIKTWVLEMWTPFENRTKFKKTLAKLWARLLLSWASVSLLCSRASSPHLTSLRVYFPQPDFYTKEGECSHNCYLPSGCMWIAVMQQLFSDLIKGWMGSSATTFNRKGHPRPHDFPNLKCTFWDHSGWTLSCLNVWLVNFIFFYQRWGTFMIL